MKSIFSSFFPLFFVIFYWHFHHLKICFSSHIERNSRVSKLKQVLRSWFWWFLVIFTTYKRLLALESKETVLWPNGHQFWEVDFWWFFGHFHHVYVFFGSKIERNGRMTKRTPVLRSHFLMTFWSFLPFIRVFLTLKSKRYSLVWQHLYIVWETIENNDFFHIQIGICRWKMEQKQRASPFWIWLWRN